MLTLAAFTWIDWTLLGAYLALMLAIGAWVSRGQGDEEGYFLGSRRMPAWAVMLSIMATSLSAATFIGVPQLSYTGDLTYLMLNLGSMLAAVIVAGLFLPPLYHAGTLTIYGYLERRFGRSAVVAASVCFLIGRLLASGARLFIPCIAFCLILFDKVEIGPLIVTICLFGLVGTIYTGLGGIKAVIWTDALQIVLIVGAAVVSIVVLYQRIDMPLGDLVGVLREAGPGGSSKMRVLDTTASLGKSTTLWAAFAATGVNVAAYGADQDLVQRMLSTKSAWRASLSLIGSNLLSIPVVGLFLVIGLLLWVYYGMPQVMGQAMPGSVPDGTREVYPFFLIHHLPTGVSGLAMAGLMAAAMSSVDSAMNAMASSVVGDLMIGPTPEHPPGVGQAHDNHGADQSPSPGLVNRSRLTVAGMGVLLTGFAVLAALLQRGGGQSLIDFALGVMNFAYAGLLGVFVTALFTRRGSPHSVIAALITGAVAVLILQPYVLGPITAYGLGEPITLAWPYWMPLAGGLSFLVCASSSSSFGGGHKGEVSHASP